MEDEIARIETAPGQQVPAGDGRRSSRRRGRVAGRAAVPGRRRIRRLPRQGGIRDGKGFTKKSSTRLRLDAR